jgi:hypothetical protein
MGMLPHKRDDIKVKAWKRQTPPGAPRKEIALLIFVLSLIKSDVLSIHFIENNRIPLDKIEYWRE